MKAAKDSCVFVSLYLCIFTVVLSWNLFFHSKEKTSVLKNCVLLNVAPCVSGAF